MDAVEVPTQTTANEEEEDVSDVRKMMNTMGLADPSKGGKERICGLCLEKYMSLLALCSLSIWYDSSLCILAENHIRIRRLQPDDDKYCYACQTEFNLTSSQGSGANESPLYHKFNTSTKIEKMIEILEETKQQNPGEKTIIFSQVGYWEMVVIRALLLADACLDGKQTSIIIIVTVHLNARSDRGAAQACRI